MLSLSTFEESEEVDEKEMEALAMMDEIPSFKGTRPNQWDDLRHTSTEEKKDESKKGEKLKQLPENLKYVFLDTDNRFPMIISSNLEALQEDKLVKVLKKTQKCYWMVG